MKIIIMAGGSGTRLWPLSRKQKPKQFQRLLGNHTMLQESVLRLLDDFDINDIFISTNKQYLEEIKSQLPELKESNIILEPERRDTAPSIGLSSVLASDNNDESLAFLTSDHYIQRKTEFRTLLKVSDKFLKDYPEYIVTLGITPTAPETGYGYIKSDITNKLGSYLSNNVYSVKAFVEKPDLETAERYIQDESYLWNSGMFIVKRGTILKQFKTNLPETYKVLDTIDKSKGKPNLLNTIESEYPKVEKISIDYAIMEKMDKIAVIPANIGWSDIGSWSALKDILVEQNSQQEHHYIGEGEYLDLGSENVLIHSDQKKLISTIGVSNLIIVDTKDALLVCSKEKSQNVKKMVELLESKNLTDKL